VDLHTRGADALLGMLRAQPSAAALNVTHRNAPEWCSQLLASQGPDAWCFAPFTHISRTAHIKRSRTYLRDLGGVGTDTPNWMGLTGQDWWLWYNHARFLRRRGFFVDLATNDPIWRSNTYFLEACMQWGGLCIEASKMHHARIIKERPLSTLIPDCISSGTADEVHFNDKAGFHGGASSVVTAKRPAPLRGESIKLRCRSLHDVFSQNGVKHVDFLSLDIEGYEATALQSVDFTKVTIDIIIAEIQTEDKDDVSPILKAAGYRKIAVNRTNWIDQIFVRKGFKLGIERRGLQPTDWQHVPPCQGGKCDPRSKSCTFGYKTTQS